VTLYLHRFRLRARADGESRAEAVRLGIDRPRAQFPMVDTRRCIGCGSCADACPEGRVLGVVDGVARVINGLKCVGHARCAEACPVGAIEVGLGDLKARSDVPTYDDWHETNVPGLFVAGEVGGLALVRHAVVQGRRVAERIAQRRRESPRLPGSPALDVIVVGGGPAGLATAAVAREKGLSCLVVEQEQGLGGTIYHYPRRKLVLVASLDLPGCGVLPEGEYSKEHLLEVFGRMVSRAGIEVAFGEKVSDVRRGDGGFTVVTSRKARQARWVVLAVGRRGTPRKLGVPGEERPEVLYELKDAESYTHQKLLVVGGGDSAVEAAIGLSRQPGNQVTLSYRREALVRIKAVNERRIQELIARGRVRTLFSSEVSRIEKGRVWLRAADRELELPNDYTFVFAGGEPPFGFLRKVGIRFGGDPAAPSAVPPWPRAPLLLGPFPSVR